MLNQETMREYDQMQLKPEGEWLYINAQNIQYDNVFSPELGEETV